MKKVIIIALIGILSIFSPIIAYAAVESIYDPVPDLNNYTLDEVFSNTEQPLTNYIIDDLTTLQSISSFNNNLVSGGSMTVDFDQSHDYYIYYDGSTQSYAMTEPLIGIDAGITIESEQLTIDEPITELDWYTLREVFESTTPALTNLITNGDFSDGTTGWELSNVTGDVTNGIYSCTATAQNGWLGQDGIVTLANNVYLIAFRIYSASNEVIIITGNNTDYSDAIYHSGNGWQTVLLPISYVGKASSSNSYIIIRDTRASGWTEIKATNATLFNLTASHGVTATSGTAYDNAVAEIEWFLSINDGYLQNQVNWFQFLRDNGVDLTVAQMDYYYSLHQALSYNESLPNEVSNNFYTNDDVAIYLTPLKAINQYSPLYDTTFDLMSDAEIKTQMDLWISYLDEWQSVNDHIIIDLTTIFDEGNEPSDTQMEKYHAFFLDPTQTGFIDLDPLQVYVNIDANYNLSMLESNKIYSPLNFDTFDNLTESEQELQFNQWSFRDIENEKVLSFSYFSSLFPLLTLADMITWYNVYLNFIAVDDLARNTIDDTEKTILIIALILYAIGIFIALYTKNKIVFVGSSLLWFIPIVIIPNLFIIVFSSIMLIASILIAYYPNKESDFE